MLLVETSSELSILMETALNVSGYPHSIKINDSIDQIILKLGGNENEEPLLMLDGESLYSLTKLLTGKIENALGKDVHGRPRFNDDFKTPHVDLFITRLIRQIFEACLERGLPLVRKQFWPNGAPHAACITHDIDGIKPRSWKKWLYRGLFFGRLPWRIDEIIKIEKKLDVSSTYFFLVNATTKWDPRNEDEDLKEAIALVKREGFDIQLHGSYETQEQASLLATEKKTLEELTSSRIVGNRQHFLRCVIPETLEILERSGFQFDSSLGIAQFPGFRNGMSFPFHPYDPRTNRFLGLLEIPLIIMDVSLKKYQKVSVRQAWKIFLELNEMIQKNGGLMTILWHNLLFGHPFTRGWQKLFEQMIKTWKKAGAFIGSASEIHDWWIRRQEAAMVGEWVSESEIRWHLKGTEGLRVEVYLPDGWSMINDEQVEIMSKEKNKMVVSVTNDIEFTLKKEQ